MVKSSISSLGNSISQNLSSLGSSIVNSLSDLGSSLIDELSSLGAFITDTFMLVGDSILSGLASIGDIFNTVGDLLKDTFVSIGNLILEGISTVGNFIVNGLKEVLELLFVPSDNLFDDVQNMFNAKFGIFSQVSELVSSLTFTNDDDMPEFKITLYGSTMKFFDFSMFSAHRKFIHNLILMIAYFRFIIWLVNNAPAVVTGTGGSLSEKGGNE